MNDTTIHKAEDSIRVFLEIDSLSGKSFLYIGSGSGIFSIAASHLGASPVLGMDVNFKCVDVARNNAEKFGGSNKPDFVVKSILDDSVDRVNSYDIVYAWGSLHHTGNMYKAIHNAANRVATGGILVIAIYNKHITSPIWKLIKSIYNSSPVFF